MRVTSTREAVEATTPKDKSTTVNHMMLVDKWVTHTAGRNNDIPSLTRALMARIHQVTSGDREVVLDEWTCDAQYQADMVREGDHKWMAT